MQTDNTVKRSCQSQGKERAGSLKMNGERSAWSVAPAATQNTIEHSWLTFQTIRIERS